MISRDWIRLCHRWLGIILTLAILTNFVAMAFGIPPSVVVYAPLASFGSAAPERPLHVLSTLLGGS